MSPKTSGAIMMENEYLVERIVNKRISRQGRTEYFVKWLGWHEDNNTWEPEEHLNKCKALIARFEAKTKLCRNKASKMQLYKLPKVSGFDRGLNPERIVGATNNGEVTFLMKWRENNQLELVPSRVARYKCPELVIRFYEKHISWHN